MAVIQTTAIVAGVTGKLAGTVARRHRGQIVLSNKVTPRNNSSRRMQKAKANLSFLQKHWKELPQSTRNQWTEVAKKFAFIEKDGVIHNPTGFNLFVGNQMHSRTSGDIPADVPSIPPVLVQPKFSNVRTQIALQRIAFVYEAANSPFGAVILMYTSLPGAASVGARFNDVVYTARTTVVNGINSVSLSYASRGTTFKAGDRINVVFLIKYTGGWVSSRQTFSLIAS